MVEGASQDGSLLASPERRPGFSPLDLDCDILCASARCPCFGRRALAGRDPGIVLVDGGDLVTVSGGGSGDGTSIESVRICSSCGS